MVTAVSTRLRRSTRTHDEYVVRVGRRKVVATVTAHAGAARRWVHATRWRLGPRLRANGVATVGMGVQWTPPFRRATVRPGTLQLCAGHRCLVLQLARTDADADAAVPAALRRFLADERVVFVGYGVRSDCRKLEEQHGLEVARTVELRSLAGMGNTSMQRMAEEHLGWDGVTTKPRKVGTSRWDARRLSKEQVQYACVDAYLSFRLAVHVVAAPEPDATSSTSSSE
uniref:3'-5' exonuclease domain-containing protein n=1 Tax=Oryza meridionalis TaxID=40149 RepID=A0A0E0CIX3_9ORYZ